MLEENVAPPAGPQGLIIQRRASALVPDHPNPNTKTTSNAVKANASLHAPPIPPATTPTPITQIHQSPNEREGDVVVVRMVQPARFASS